MKQEKMTSRERVMAAINRKEFDHFPVINPTSIANYECMQIAGASFPQAHTNAHDMAQIAALGHTVLGFDSVMPYFSVHLEAEALGCQIQWGDGSGMPVIVGQALRRMEDFEPPKNFLNKTPCKELLKAIRLLKKQFGNEVAIIGKVIGPWSLAYNLYGVENLLLDVILEQEHTQTFINSLLEIPIAFAKAQFNAGADLITWADHVTGDLMSAKLYEEFMFPIHKKAAAQLFSYGPVILHTCGNVMDRLELIRRTGFRAFHIDSRNDIKKAVQIAGNDLILTGSINNPHTLTSGTPLQVRNEVLANLQSGIQLISPECAIPFKVSNRNLIELALTAHRAPVDSGAL